MKLMKIYVRPIIIMYLFCCTLCHAETNPNETLQKALLSLTPELHGRKLLSATVIRTIYEEQDLESKKEPEVERTIVSQMTINSDKVIETVCDTSKAKDLIKFGAEELRDSINQYVYDGSNFFGYDGRKDRGLTRSVPNNADINPILSFFDPLAAVGANRFVSRIVPNAYGRLQSVEVIKAYDEGELIVLEGKYNDSDPEKTFTMKINPQLGFFIVGLWEYDKDHRLLSEMRTGDILEIKSDSAHLFAPSKRIVVRYRYDDFEGNSIQKAVLDILQPKTVTAASDDDFASYPKQARIYDAVNYIDLGRIKMCIKKGICLECGHPLTEHPDHESKMREGLVSGHLHEHDLTEEPVSTFAMDNKASNNVGRDNTLT